MKNIRKMKVVFISTFALDANVSLIKELKEQCDIYFITEALHKVYNYIDKDKLSKTFSTGDEVDEMKRFGDLIPLHKTYVVKGCRQMQILKKLSNSYKIHSLIKKINPDVILSDNTALTYLFSQICYRKKTLLIVHDPFLHSGEQFLVERLLRKFFFSIISHKILLNESQRSEFIRVYKHDETKLYSSFLSIYEYLTCFQTQKNDTDSQCFNVLFFGRISPYKGIKYLLDAFINIANKEGCGNIKLTIAGSGNFDFDTTPYEHNDKICILNKYIESYELADLILSSSVVICPYVDATQSGVVMSAFAFKKPVIATNVGGLPEMVKDNETGLIIEPKSVSEIENNILKLYNDPDLLQSMQKNIEKKYFEGERSWKQSATLFMDALSDIINHN